MSREKQIIEMREDICKAHICDVETYDECIMTNGECMRCRRVAEHLYKVGYRKQSEGEWIWKSNGYMKCLHCSCCGNQEEWETAFCPKCGAKMKGGE